MSGNCGNLSSAVGPFAIKEVIIYIVIRNWTFSN
jgi:2-methylaconitate cis-trans-isomerase PrpF